MNPAPQHQGGDSRQWFAQYQPFTPFTETVRGLPLGGNAVHAIRWSILHAIGGHAWSMLINERESVR